MKGKNMKKIVLSTILIGSLSLSACQTTGFNKENIGTGAGAILGGLAAANIGKGSGRLWAVGAGVLLGSLAGSEIGKSLDRADRLYLSQASQSAQSAPIGETITWNNPDSGNRGTVTPTRDGYSNSGRYCREFQQVIIVGGREQEAYGTACQQPDGAWEIQS